MKNALDKFYTKPEVAKECVSFARGLCEWTFAIEPSAGSGSFLPYIGTCFAMDIEPEGDGIIAQDFFTFVSPKDPGIMVIGNPPFGEYNTLSVRFFNKAAEFAKYIAFILPKSFKKPSIQNRLNPYFHLIGELDLKSDSFTLLNEDYAVNCVFQVWERKEELREPIGAIDSLVSLEFTTSDKADFSIRRVGGNAGKASLRVDYSAASNYFIKNKSSLTNEELVNAINEIHFPEAANTVAVNSVSKRELIPQLNYIIEQSEV